MRPTAQGPTPAFRLEELEASPGDDTARVLMCREVAEEHAGEMLLGATDLATGTEYWFDLAPPP